MLSKQNKISVAIVCIVFLLASILGIFAILKYSKESKLESKLFYEAKELVGKEVDFSKFEGFQSSLKKNDEHQKFWLIYILSSCEACKLELKMIEEMNINQDFQVIGIMVEDKEKVESFIKEQKPKFPVFIDKNGEFFKSAKLKYFPTNFIIENGIIKKSLFGMPEKQEDLIKFITES